MEILFFGTATGSYVLLLFSVTYFVEWAVQETTSADETMPPKQLKNVDPGKCQDICL